MDGIGPLPVRGGREVFMVVGENRDIMCVTEQLVVRHFRGGDTHTHTHTQF